MQNHGKRLQGILRTRSIRVYLKVKCSRERFSDVYQKFRCMTEGTRNLFRSVTVFPFMWLGTLFRSFGFYIVESKCNLFSYCRYYQTAIMT